MDHDDKGCGKKDLFNLLCSFFLFLLETGTCVYGRTLFGSLRFNLLSCYLESIDFVILKFYAVFRWQILVRTGCRGLNIEMTSRNVGREKQSVKALTKRTSRKPN